MTTQPVIVETASERRGRADQSMHDHVEVSCDCCSCEAEPYWLEAFADADENLVAAGAPCRRD